MKPLIAAAVLSRYPRLRTLQVDHPGETFVSAAGWRLGGGEPFASAMHGCRSPVGWECALPGSNNLFAVTLGMLGLAADGGASGLPALDRRSVVGPAYRIEGRTVDARARLAVRGGGTARAGSPLAQRMAQLFDARIVQAPADAFDTTLWAGLRDADVVGPIGAGWQRVSPELVQLPLAGARYDTLRYLAGFLIGERDQPWSNAAFARAYSRLATGRAVELRMLRRVGDRALAPVVARELPFGPGRAAVLDGMRGVVRSGTGARAGLALPSPSLELFGKTGTAEGDGTRGGPTPVSRFVFIGRPHGTPESRKGAPMLCPAVGAILVEAERDAAGRLPAVDLFADAVAPVLRERLGWDGKHGASDERSALSDERVCLIAER